MLHEIREAFLMRVHEDATSRSTSRGVSNEAPALHGPREPPCTLRHIFNLAETNKANAKLCDGLRHPVDHTLTLEVLSLLFDPRANR